MTVQPSSHPNVLTDTDSLQWVGQSAPAETRTSGNTATTSSAAKVLIADANPDVRQSLEQLVSKAGYATQIAVETDDVLRQTNDTIAAVVLNLRLPTPDCRRCLRQIRQRSSHTEVLVLLERHEAGNQVVAVEAGAFDYVYKPINTDELLMRLQNATSKYLLTRENRQLRGKDAKVGPVATSAPAVHEQPHLLLAGRTISDIEQQAIMETLTMCGGNKARAARELGVSEKTIYNKMRRYGLTWSK